MASKPVFTPQQIAAVVATRDFLRRLGFPHDSHQGRWKPIRMEARGLLRQYPLEEELLEALQNLD